MSNFAALEASINLVNYLKVMNFYWKCLITDAEEYFIELFLFSENQYLLVHDYATCVQSFRIAVISQVLQCFYYSKLKNFPF